IARELSAEASPPTSSPSESPARSAAPRNPHFHTVIWLAALLILVLGGLASSPFWAKTVGRLLPWGEKPSAADYDVLAARLAALERRPVPTTNADTVDRRLAALEAAVGAVRRQDEAATTAALAQVKGRVEEIAAQTAARAAEVAASTQKLQQEL